MTLLVFIGHLTWQECMLFRAFGVYFSGNVASIVGPKLWPTRVVADHHWAPLAHWTTNQMQVAIKTLSMHNFMLPCIVA